MRLKPAVIMAILAALFPLGNQALATNLIDPAYGWRSPNRAARISFQKTGIILSSRRSSTGLYNRRPLNISTEEFDLVEIRMKTSKSGLAELSWRQAGQPFQSQRSFSFFLRAPDRYHTYYLNLKPYIKEGRIDHLLFFPFNQAGRADVATFKLIKGNLWQKTQAAWQEFWGPTGRSYTGSSFFVIKSPRVFNRAILFYLNWLIGLSLALSLVYKRPRLTIVLILSFWLMLAASSAVNNWVFFQDDLRFWGKSLTEKRILQNEKDFYQFIEFAETRMPARSSFTILADPQYPYAWQRAAYYLYPRPRQAAADYILVFDRTPDTKTMRNYSVAARFRQGAYILKRHDDH
jgi:hypothetical protein